MEENHRELGAEAKMKTWGSWGETGDREGLGEEEERIGGRWKGCARDGRETREGSKGGV